MSDPDFFKDGAAVRSASEEHDALTEKISGLYEEWEAVQVAISV